MSDHIDGPWHYQEGADAYTHIVRTPSNGFVCQLAQDTTGRSEARGRLIAAAPEMLAVLRRIRDSYRGYIPDFVEAVNAAIDKATPPPPSPQGGIE